MPKDQGQLALLETDLAKRLLASATYARLAYVWPDGTPRVVPIWFTWTGDEIVFASGIGAPKAKALRANPAVAVTIDTEGFPCDVLMLRGAAKITETDDVVPEYAQAAHRYLGDEAAAGFLAPLKGWPMVRIAVRPTWVGTLDFQTRFPSALEG